MKHRHLICVTLLLLVNSGLGAATIFSTEQSYLGTGEFHGPGSQKIVVPLFEATMRNIGFTNSRDFVTPFRNTDATLSDGTLVNENVILGDFVVAGVRMRPAVVHGGQHKGQQLTVTMEDGNLYMVMDFALDLGIDERGVIRLPFYGTTGKVSVPFSAQTEKGLKDGIDQAGRFRSGETISGRIGDFNGDGFIDGTLVATGRMPLSSPIYPGQPYVIVRHFETDILIDGMTVGSPARAHAAYSDD